jgi:hypothetical protein
MLAPEWLVSMLDLPIAGCRWNLLEPQLQVQLSNRLINNSKVLFQRNLQTLPFHLSGLLLHYSWQANLYSLRHRGDSRQWKLLRSQLLLLRWTLL